MPRSILIIVIFVSAVVLSGCGLSLAEDITPPPNYRPPTPVTETVEPVEVAVVFPQAVPNMERGQAIYEEKCVQCHGETGLGDGPQAGQLTVPVAAVGSPELARASRPAEWFQVVTQGRMERFMPPFVSLDDQQRWDVVAYLYALSHTPAVLEEGKTLYEANCATCHGAAGLGDGDQAASLSSKAVNFTDTRVLAGLSEAEIAQVVAEGKGEMPAFDSLSEDQRLVLAAYTRTLSFSGAPGENVASGETQPGAGSTDSGQEPSGATGSGDTAGDQIIDTLTISGQVTSATPGSELPTDMKVALLGFNGMTQAFTLDGSVDAEGNFRFEDVEFNPNYVYLAQLQANGMTFNSDIVHGSDVTGQVVDLPIKIYDTSTDASTLKADRMHIFFDFSDPGMVQVVELFIISNLSEKVVIPANVDQPLISFVLPPGATNLQFEDGALGERYVATTDGFGDRSSVQPGEGQHQVLFAYQLPYERKLDLQLTSPLPVDAAVVMVPQSGVRLSSEQLTDAGERDVQGMTFHMYQATAAIQPDQPLTMQLNGRVDGSTDAVDPLVPVLAAGGIFLVALGGAIFWYMRQRGKLQPALVTDGYGDAAGDEAEEDETSETLLEAIVALDDMYQAGDLPEKAYQERRAHLKGRLAQIMEKESNG